MTLPEPRGEKESVTQGNRSTEQVNHVRTDKNQRTMSVE